MSENDYLDIENQFKTASKIASFRWITPINLKEENNKLINSVQYGDRYDPHYEYIPCDYRAICQAEDILHKLQFPDNKIGKLYRKVCESKIKELQMYKSVTNPEKFTSACRNVYGIPDESKRDFCMQILLKNSTDDTYIYNAEALKSYLYDIIRRYQLDSWQINIKSDLGSKVLVGNHVIMINKNKLFSQNDLKRLGAHEISTHVLRNENGYRRKHVIFSEGTANSMETEEGLAIYNEEKAGVMNLQILKLYAARYLCTLEMDRLSLYELVMLIKDFIGLEQAVYIASRIKVGLCDTSSGGGFNKDFIYLQGYLKVKEHLEKKPEDYVKLYYGVISLNDINLLEDEINVEMEHNNILLPIEIIK